MSLSPAWRTRTVAIFRHPRVGLAWKAALAATLSWWLALQLPDPAASYAFYAPFGAVATMYPTVVGSFRESLRSLTAITLGALVALAVDAALGPGVLVIGVVVVLGVLLGGLRALGDHRVYVPVVGLFVLVLGQGQELDYAAAYAGLFALGAAVAMAVNAVLPSLPLRQVDGVMSGLRTALTSHLVYLAEQLDDDRTSDRTGDGDNEGDGTTVDRQGPGRPRLVEPTARARDVVEHVQEAARGNRRARRYLPAVSHAYDSFRALERVGMLVEDLYDLLEDRPWGTDPQDAPVDLRAPVARALRALAGVVEDVGTDTPDEEGRAAVERAIAELTLALREDRHGRLTAPDGAAVHGSPQDGPVDQGPEDEEASAAEARRLVVSTIITTLRRCLAVLTPAEHLSMRVM